MSKFTLKPARLLQTRLVTSKTDEVLELSFQQLLSKLAPTRDRIESSKLLGLRPGSFVGLADSSRTPGKKIVFVLFNEDLGGNIDFVLRKDPSFEKRLLEAYRVEEAVYDGVISEEQLARQVA